MKKNMLPSLRKKKDTYKQEPENGDSNPFDSLVGGSLRLFKGHFFTIEKKVTIAELPGEGTSN